MVPQHLLDGLRPPRLRPALWHALADLTRRRDPCNVHHNQEVWHDFVRRHRQWSGAWARTPELAAVGLQLIDRSRPSHERIEGCIWLAMFPSVETVSALATIAFDTTEPIELRNQATWPLGYRQLQQNHDTCWWEPHAVESADEALLALWRGPDRDALTELGPAMRHVSSPEVLDAFASDVVAAAPAIEAFATPKLAAALLDRLEQLASEHAPRIIRLVAHVLGPDIVRRLLAYAETAPMTERVEALMTALSLNASLALPAVESYLGSLRFDRVARARAAWHRANPGVMPTVRALAIARVTAVLPREERTERCRAAAQDFASLAAVEPYPEAYLYDLWRHVAFRSRDDACLVACVESAPSMLEHGPYLVAPYLGALARAGRFEHMVQVARDHAATSQAAWLFATHGRPFYALAMRRLATAAGSTPEAAAAGALALFFAGRPDLASLSLERDRPSAENLVGEGILPFPGPDELWRVEHEPETCPAIAALVDGTLPGLLSYARGAPDGADPDLFDFNLIVERERELQRHLAGATVCFVGAVPDATVAEVVAKGAQIVDGPFAKTDYFVAGSDADPAAIARLRSMGVTELTGS